MLDRRPALALLVAALAVAPPAVAQNAGPGPLPPSGPPRAEVTNILIDETRAADVVAVLVLSWDQDQLCANLAIPARPRAPKVGNFNLTRYIELPDGDRNHNLKFDFPSRGTKEGEGEDAMPTWQACLVTEPHLPNAAKDEVAVTVREASMGGKRQVRRFFLPFPTADVRSKVTFRRDETGALYVHGG